MKKSFLKHHLVNACKITYNLFFLLLFSTLFKEWILDSGIFLLRATLHGGDITKIINVYTAGYSAIGLPMAIMSAIFYLWGEDFSKSKWHTFLDVIRNMLHPPHFALFFDCEFNENNQREHFLGPIKRIIDPKKPTLPQVLTYVFLSAAVWPIKLSITGFICLITLFIILCILLFGLMYALLIAIIKSCYYLFPEIDLLKE